MKLEMITPSANPCVIRLKKCMVDEVPGASLLTNINNVANISITIPIITLVI